jgi:hypothetical protein
MGNITSDEKSSVIVDDVHSSQDNRLSSLVGLYISTLSMQLQFSRLTHKPNWRPCKTYKHVRDLRGAFMFDCHLLELGLKARQSDP